jgi:hypothetical protein
MFAALRVLRVYVVCAEFSTCFDATAASRTAQMASQDLAIAGLRRVFWWCYSQFWFYVGVRASQRTT